MENDQGNSFGWKTIDTFIHNTFYEDNFEGHFFNSINYLERIRKLIFEQSLKLIKTTSNKVYGVQKLFSVYPLQQQQK